MDLLPVAFSGATTNLHAVRVERKVDLSRRRAALQLKAGVGLTATQFRTAASKQAVGHVGLDSSARLIADALGMARDWPVVSLEPSLNDSGRVVGFVQTTGYPPRDGQPEVSLRLEMSMQLDQPETDRILIDATPSITAVIEGGIFGDTATAALVVNAIPQVLATQGGLLTVLDVPPARAWKQWAQSDG